MNLKKSELTFRESMNFVNSVVDSCFTQDENGNDIDYSPACKLPLIQATFCEYYTDIEFLPTEDEEGNTIEGAFDKNFSTYMNVNIDDTSLTTPYDDGGVFLNRLQWEGILSAIDEQIEFRKQKMLNSQTKPVDEMFDMFNTLLSTLNDKAKELDPKKLEKVIKKLNPQEVIKAYQKMGVGQEVRDKAIEELAKENKELKNQISARNVMADKKVD